MIESLRSYEAISSLESFSKSLIQSSNPIPIAKWQQAFSSNKVLKNKSPVSLTGELNGTSATSPSLPAPSSKDVSSLIVFNVSSSLAKHSTTLPFSNLKPKSLITLPFKDNGLAAYTTPSALYLLGVVKHSYVGILGL